MASPEGAYDIKQFEQTWASPAGPVGRLAAVNYQPLAKRFMVTSFAFMILAGIMALVMRVQLAVPENDVVGPEVYNRLFTMHGSIMLYVFAVPFLEGLSLYLIPPMIGSRDAAFPRLTAFSFWTYFFGSLVFIASFAFGTVPDAGWFAYTPLSTARYSGMGVDFWVLGLGLIEIGGIAAAAEMVVTILKLRAPGMSLDRLPIFAWAVLAMGLMILFAFTTLLTATFMLELDRSVGTRFFDTERGGSSLLWQHLFWFFGHPEVYIIFLPAAGIVSAVVATFARRLVAYRLIVVAIVLMAFVSFGLWVHHMYTTGLPELSMYFFAAASLMVAIASGIQVFAWIASLWGRRPPLTTPMLFVLGFLFIFVLGGMTGVMVALIPFDLQVHDTYFVVAHFHYVLIGGAVFPIMAGLYYWMPKLTGRLLDHRFGRWSFWLTFVGFNATFLPMHWIGFYGMPRRVYTYPEELGISGENLFATVGSFVLAAGFGAFVLDFLLSFRRTADAPIDPWGGDTLEWSIASPTPPYTFSRPPIVRGRHPLWAVDSAGDEDEATERAQAALTYAPIGWRATLGTDVLTGRPQSIQYLPGPSFLPLFAALGLLIASIGVLVKAPLVLGAGALVTGGTLVKWLWPREAVVQMLRDSPVPAAASLPVFVTRNRSTGWWGMICLMTVLGTVLAALFYSYFYLRLFSETWPQGDLPYPDLAWPGLAFGVLAASGGAMWAAMRGHRDENRLWYFGGLAGAMLLGLAGLGLIVASNAALEFGPRKNAYASLYYVINGAFGVIASVGLIVLFAALVRSRRGFSDREGFMAVQLQITSLFWYFVVIAGVLVFGVLNLSPYLL